MTVATVTTSPAATRVRATAAFTRIATHVTALARKGAGTGLGAASLAAGVIGAGAQWGWPVGLMVACPLGVWFASLLPGEPS